MAYTIAYTDEANNGVIVVEDRTINNQTSIKIPGRQYTGYGPAIAENFLHMLENFSSSNPPPRPTEGQLWYDNTLGIEQLKVYDGTSWVPAGGLNKGTNEPDVALTQEGDLWVDTDNRQLYLNSGSEWILIGPDFADGLATGSSPRQIVAIDNQVYSVTVIEVDAQVVSIISSFEFTPKTVIPGFTTIRPGINLANRDITGSGIPKFIGRAETAEALLVNNEPVEAGNFLRGDAVSTTLFPINIQNNSGVVIGTDAALNIGIEGQAGLIEHQIEGSSIDVRVKSGGISQTVLRVDSAQRLGINNEAPDEALDVIGNAKISGTLQIDSTQQSTDFDTGAIVTKGGVGVAKNLNVAGDSTFANLATFANVRPDGNNTRNLGSSNEKWQQVFATDFIGDLTGNVNGTVSGIAGEAEQLETATTFRITGDVAANDIVFDGKTGGSFKTFTTTLNNAVISSKDSVLSTLGTDELLLNRTEGTSGLFKVSQKTLLDSVPTNPPGVVMPYVGDTEPPGWKFCDGSEYLKADYSDLFEAIGFKFGGESTVTPGFFRVPDLRGRMPLGADNMGGTSADTVQASYADFVGAEGGQEDTEIAVQNLPQHVHDLRSTDGEQFFATREDNTTPVGNESTASAPTSFGNAQKIPNSGGVDSADELGQPLNLMNPSLTFNYIIYMGRIL